MAAIREMFTTIGDMLMVMIDEVRVRPRQTVWNVFLLFAVIFPFALLIALLLQKVW